MSRPPSGSRLWAGVRGGGERRPPFAASERNLALERGTRQAGALEDRDAFRLPVRNEEREGMQSGFSFAAPSLTASEGLQAQLRLMLRKLSISK